jgi:molecular chaperone DnaK (HSP70)
VLPSKAALTAASLAAAKHTNNAPPRAADVVLSSVAPHTLGIALANGESDPLIPQGTALPVTRRERYTTQKDNQPVVTVKVVEGDETTAAANRVLGKFNLKVPPAPAGEPQIIVKFTLSADGILSVSAKDEDTGHRHAITVDGSGTMGAGDKGRARKQVAKARGGTGGGKGGSHNHRHSRPSTPSN